MRLIPEQRLTLIDHINALVQVGFERLVFTLDVPRSVVPSNFASQGDRSAALLAWVNSPTGCGMVQLLKSLGSIAPLPSILSPSRLDSPVVSPGRSPSRSEAASPFVGGTNGVQIFLAHAKEDEAQVMELYERLCSRGYRPWLDKKDLLPGQNWRKAITRAISQSDIFVACLSSRSVRKQGYVQQEFRLALNVLAQKPPDTIYLIPLRLDDCEIPDLRQSEYGVNMRDYQWLNYFEADGYERLERALSYQIGQGLGVPVSFADAPRSAPSPSHQQSSPSLRPSAAPKPVSPPSSSPSVSIPIAKPRANGAHWPARSPRSKLRPSPSRSKKRGVGSKPSLSSIPLSRRRMLQILGFTGGSAGVWWLGRMLVRWSFDASSLPPQEPFGDGSMLGFNVALVDVASKSIAVTRETVALRRESLGEDLFLELVEVPAGSFLMGSPEKEIERWDSEGPQHEVTLKSFWMSRFPITQAQWKAIASWSQVDKKLEAAPSIFTGDNRPVENVSWNDAVEACKRLSARFASAEESYRLPSEAEWEYACRAGTKTPFHFGETITPAIANYNGNSSYGDGPKGEYRRETTSVGQFNIANAFGLSDMHGNVWEWCQDSWHDNYEGAPLDGSAWQETPPQSNRRVVRGGSWDGYPRLCRSASRFYDIPDVRSDLIGFRVVLAPR